MNMTSANQSGSTLSGPPYLRALAALVRVPLRFRRTMIRLLADYELTPAQFITLTHIPEEGAPLTQLAETLLADPSTVSGIVDRLERDGLARRERAPEDRRVVRVVHTDKARKLLRQTKPQHDAAVREMMQVLSEEELQQLARLLTRLDEHLARWTEEQEDIDATTGQA